MFIQNDRLQNIGISQIKVDDNNVSFKTPKSINVSKIEKFLSPLFPSYEEVPSFVSFFNEQAQGTLIDHTIKPFYYDIQANKFKSLKDIAVHFFHDTTQLVHFDKITSEGNILLKKPSEALTINPKVTFSNILQMIYENPCEVQLQKNGQVHITAIHKE